MDNPVVRCPTASSEYLKREPVPCTLLYPPFLNSFTNTFKAKSTYEIYEHYWTTFYLNDKTWKAELCPNALTDLGSMSETA